MKYELDVLAALTQLSQPTTREIVDVTGISERKVQNVIKTLKLDLQVELEKIKKGRSFGYEVTDWGVFESALLLKRKLLNRPLKKSLNTTLKDKKAAYYDSVKMSNYKESSRLEGVITNAASTQHGENSVLSEKRSLIEKYAKYKNVNHNHG